MGAVDVIETVLARMVRLLLLLLEATSRRLVFSILRAEAFVIELAGTGAGYERSDRVAYPVPRTRDELPNKDWVTGIVVNGEALAISLRALAAVGRVEHVIGGVPIEVRQDAQSESVTVMNQRTGQLIPSVNLYWFAWQAFHPHTILWTPQTESTAIQ